MMSESEWVRERWNLYNVMQAHPDWSLRAYAREVNHDPKWVRKWVARLKAQATPTLSMFASQSRRPKHSPSQLEPAVKDHIGELRGVLSERFNRTVGTIADSWGPVDFCPTSQSAADESGLV